MQRLKKFFDADDRNQHPQANRTITEAETNYDGFSYIPKPNYEMRNPIMQKSWWAVLNYKGSPGQLEVFYDNHRKTKLTGFQVYLPIDEHSKRNFILTCAQNFVDYSLNNALGARYFNMQTKESSTHMNNGEILSKYSTICETNPSEINNDWAIAITVSPSIVDISQYTDCPLMNFETARPKKGDRICIAGYPMEYKNELYYMEGLISDIQNQTSVYGRDIFIIYKDIQTSKGQAGSPVFLKHSDGRWVIIGIHVYYDRDKNKGYAIGFSRRKLDMLKSMAIELHNS